MSVQCYTRTDLELTPFYAGSFESDGKLQLMDGHHELTVPVPAYL